MTTTYSSTPPTLEPTRLNKYGYNSIARHLFTPVITGALFFVAAGTLRWDWAWLCCIVTFLGWTVMSLVLARANPALLNQRGQRARALKGTKPWDYGLLALYSLLLFVVPLVAGLDYRSGWSAPATPLIHLSGNLLIVLSFGLLTWSMAVNRFFEATVRLQTDRGQTVTRAGPYEWLRHPGYSAVILGFIGTPLAVGSWVALLPALAGVIVFIVRTALEDAVLQRELPGYAAYTQQTRYRLLPGVW